MPQHELRAQVASPPDRRYDPDPVNRENQNKAVLMAAGTCVAFVAATFVVVARTSFLVVAAVRRVEEEVEILPDIVTRVLQRR